MSMLVRQSTRFRSALLVLPLLCLAACGGAGAGGGQAPGAAATAKAILSHPVTNLPNITVSFTVDGVDRGSYTITQPSKV